MQRRYLSPKEVEAIYGVNAGTLANWRLYGKGPAYCKVGRLIRYEVSNLEKFFQQHIVLTSDQSEISKEHDRNI